MYVYVYVRQTPKQSRKAVFLHVGDWNKLKSSGLLPSGSRKLSRSSTGSTYPKPVVFGRVRHRRISQRDLSIFTTPLYKRNPVEPRGQPHLATPCTKISTSTSSGLHGRVRTNARQVYYFVGLPILTLWGT